MTVTFTERLRLEPVSLEAHLDDIAAMLADPLVGKTMNGVRDRAWSAERTRLHEQRWADDGFGLWAAYSLEDGGFVGRGGIQHTRLEDTDVVEAGWCLPSHRWGQGYATEVGRAGLRSGFDDHGLDEILAWTQPFNTASRNIMVKLGMSYLRDCTYVGLPHVVYATHLPPP